MNNIGIFIYYDESLKKLVFVKQKITQGKKNDFYQLLDFSFKDQSEINTQELERTLGQLILYYLEKLTPNGLGFGNYSYLLKEISKENLEKFCQDIDLKKTSDKYDLATIMFSYGRRNKSWKTVEYAINLFKQASSEGHKESKRFIEKDLPVVYSRLVEKLRNSDEN